MTPTNNWIVSTYIYLIGFFYCIFRLDIPELIAKGDIYSYFGVYGGVKMENLTDWFSIEVLLPFFYTVLRPLLGRINIEEFAEFQLFLVYSILGYALLKSSKGAAQYAVLILMLDIPALPHLARQFVSAAFVLLALVETYSKRRLGVTAILIGISALSHLTGPLFFLMAIIFTKLQSYHLRLMLLGAALLALTGTVVNSITLLNQLHGVPVFGKAFFALEVYLSSGGSNPRFFSVVGAFIMVLFPARDWQEKVTAGFLALTIAVYQLPILNARVGLIGSSVLIGLPFFLLSRYLVAFLAVSAKPRSVPK